MQNKFGLSGTTAMYRYIEELSKIHDIIVIDNDNRKQRDNIVHTNKSINLITTIEPRSTETMLKVANTAKRFHPDIIYIFNSPHSLDYLFHIKHLFPHTKWVIDFRSPLLLDGDIRKRIRKKFFYIQFYIDAIFTHSTHSANTWIPFLIRKTTLIPTGTDVHKFTPKRHKNALLKCKKFVYIGSLHEYRKLDNLFRWFDRAATRHNEITLDIYGTGPAERELLQLTKSLKAGKRICMHGQVDQCTLFRVLSTYDAGIAYVPYERYNRAPTLKSFEYTAAGLHVLASDTRGQKQIAREYDFRFDFFKNNEESFLKAVKKCIIEGVASNQIKNNLNKVTKCDFGTIVREKLNPNLQRVASK